MTYIVSCVALNSTHSLNRIVQESIFSKLLFRTITIFH